MKTSVVARYSTVGTCIERSARALHSEGDSHRVENNLLDESPRRPHLLIGVRWGDPDIAGVESRKGSLSV